MGGILGWRLSGRRRRRHLLFADEPLEGGLARLSNRLPRPLRRTLATLIYIVLGALAGLVFVAVVTRR